jgi:Zn-dependent protease with chaperone function
MNRIIQIVFVILALLTVYVYAYGQPDEARTPSTQDSDTRKDSTDEETEIEKQYGICKDPVICEKLKRVTDTILAVLTEDEKIKEYKFKILDDDDINAFASPDGTIYFFRGLIELTKSDDQLAGVVTHELTHVIHKHSKTISKEALPWLFGGILVGAVTDEPNAALAGEWIAMATAEKYGREAEEDSDKTGLELMIRAGYDPIGMLEFFSFMMEEEKRNPMLYKNYFFVHPFAHERINSLKSILLDMGYKVPDSLYRSYLTGEAKEHESEGIHLIDITLEGEILFTIAGESKEGLTARADKITKSLHEILNSGATRFEFRIVKSDNKSWIQAKGIILYEPDEKDIENAGIDSETYLKQILSRINLLMMKEQIKRRI